MTTNYHPLFCEVNMDLREAFLHTLATALDQLRVGPVSITPPLLSWLDPLRVTETMDTLQAAAQDASCGDAGFHHTKDQVWWLLFPPENFSGTGYNSWWAQGSLGSHRSAHDTLGYSHTSPEQGCVGRDVALVPHVTDPHDASTTRWEPRNAGCLPDSNVFPRNA